MTFGINFQNKKRKIKTELDLVCMEGDEQFPTADKKVSKLIKVSQELVLAPTEKQRNHEFVYRKPSDVLLFYLKTLKLKKILTENKTILEHQNKKKLQILEALHIRNIPPKLNRINFESSANVLKYLLLLTLFIETNLKSKRYTIQQYKCSLLQSSNVYPKVTSLL